jgi:2-keto-4-pentenoate hydratase/2-oxohepta-3-ene-1,7-dioic acid hydratase in catechol pathway
LRIASFRHEGTGRLGRVSQDGRSVVPLQIEADGSGVLPLVLASVNGAEPPPDAGDSLAIGAIQLLAPIPRPRRNIFCVGKNYREHAREFTASGFDSSAAKAADAIPEFPIVFSKVPESVIGPGEAIVLPTTLSNAIDYEAELAVIIGKGGRGIARAEAVKHVWGYTIVNDVTARDLQGRHKQWLIGKSLDSFCPMGPWVVTADELDGANTRVRCWVNDELRQDARTPDLIFDIATLIETISAGITLMPGDLIATGTPAGVGIGFTPPRYLQGGDRVRIEIDGIGVLENPVVAGQAQA